MFERIKSIFGGGKKPTRSEQADSYNLDDKPFTRALFLRASKYQDEATGDLKEMSGRTKPVAEPQTLEEFAASCAATIAYHVTTQARKRIGHKATFLPYDPVPNYAQMVVAFSLFVLIGIQGQLKAEGIELDFSKLAARTGNLFFLFHPDEDKLKHINEGIEAFRAVAQSDAGNVKDWHDNLMQLIPIYVLQWTTDDQEFKDLDCIHLFGSMLSSLLAALE